MNLIIARATHSHTCTVCALHPLLEWNERSATEDFGFVAFQYSSSGWMAVSLVSLAGWRRADERFGNPNGWPLAGFNPVST